MKTIRSLILLMLFSSIGAYAQTTCTDLNVYPMTKNKGTVGTYSLKPGYEEMASQTYYYSGTGSISQVRVYGAISNGLSVPLNITIYNVDSKNRPTTTIKSVSTTWYAVYNVAGYIDINVGNVNISKNFAIGVGISSNIPAYTSFNLAYNGNGEGRGEDLASLSGTSTGHNWTSAKSTFFRDGDFYILPKMNNFITAGFSMNSQCAAVNGTLLFTNSSQVSNDSMFNKIGNPKYSGSNFLYTWDFGDNSTISHAVNPVHKYSTSGMYYITLTVTFEGWASTCTNTYKRMASIGLSISATKITNIICNGNNTGSATALASGGVSPYKYSINNDNYGSNPVFPALYAGPYTLYTMDSFGCIQTTNFVITQPAAIIPITNGTINSTCGKSNGSISIVATGGTGSLTYSLGEGSFQSNGNFTGLSAGHKMITIKDSMGCTLVLYMDVNDATGPVIKVSNYKNIDCNGSKNGSITVSSTGGTGTIQYSINGTDFQATGNFNNLNPGTYGITVKDASGCIDLVSITLTQPDPIQFYTTSTPATCQASSSGTITIQNVVGGSGSYSYSIDGQNFQSGKIFTGLKAESYLVYVRDAAGCVLTVSQTVKEPAQLVASTSTTNAKCFGLNDGSITVSVNGGTAPYNYSIDGEKYQPVNVFPSVGAGVYKIMIGDANGCFYLATSATITQPTKITAAISTNLATCGNSNGKIQAQASGGSGSGYQYSIDGGVSFNNTGSFNNLKDSTYRLFIQDSKSCPIDTAVTISSTDGPKITLLNHTNVSCHGLSDGSISIVGVTGGTGALSYMAGGFYWQSSTNFTGLNAGKYNVLVKDAVGCIGSSAVTITEPTALVINTTLSNPLCHGSATGSATIFAGGGTGTMAYSLDDIHYQSSNEFTGLEAGSYTVRVRDAGQCVSTISFTLTDPLPVTILSFGTLDVSCNGANNGIITVSATGGKGKLTYSLNGVNYQSSGIFTNLAGGNYNVFVKDSNNCIASQYGLRIDEPAQLTALAEIQNVVCSGGNDGVIILTAFGGTRPYKYQWSNFATTEDLFNVKAGTYSVDVTDAKGCKFSASYVVTQPAKPLIVNGAIVNAHTGLSDGSIKLAITGGSGFFDFHWSNGATTQDVSGLAPGEYTVIVKDVTGCQVSETFLVSTNSGIDANNSEYSSPGIYPNPANSIITIDANNKIVDRVIIMSLDGKVVFDLLVNDINPKINTSSLTNGIYILNCIIGGNTYRTRLGIQR